MQLFVWTACAPLELFKRGWLVAIESEHPACGFPSETLIHSGRLTAQKRIGREITRALRLSDSNGNDGIVQTDTWTHVDGTIATREHSYKPLGIEAAVSVFLPTIARLARRRKETA